MVVKVSVVVWITGRPAISVVIPDRISYTAFVQTLHRASMAKD